MIDGLTKDEATFVMRMLPHFMLGMSVNESAQAVLGDDARIFAALCDRSHSYFADIGDGHSSTTRQGAGNTIAKELTAKVYTQLRSDA